MIKKLTYSLVLLTISSMFFQSVKAQKAYFQQKVDYTIDVKLDDQKHELHAFERMVYTNNSPSVLKEIYIHLWPNAYKNNNTDLAKQFLANGSTKFYYADASQRGYIDSLKFKVDDKPVRLVIDTIHIDIAKIVLNEPLMPGSSIVITTPFHVKIPEGIFSRMGHLGQAYQITQWYPKPAVFDNLGWHPMPYLNQGEFYSEFGSFDVRITIPKNYVVGSTGDLVDGEAEYDFLMKKVQETTAITKFSKDMSFPPSDKEWKTIRYKQTNIHDFAWFADKRFHVLKGEITLPRTNHTVTSWAMFTNSEPLLWMSSIEYLNDAIKYYSQWNGDYPYNHVTAIDGALTAGAGMEYPNITVIGPSGNATAHEIVIVHEVGHNWFYGMLGSNERDHPWMDEGINSFNELRYMYTKYPDLRGKSEIGDLSRFKTRFNIDRITSKNIKYMGYLIAATHHTEQPIDTASAVYTDFNYGSIVYGKTALAFDYLKEYLGQETFDKAMQSYFDQWHFKHPYPDDFRRVMEQSTGKKLNWFFDQMIRSTDHIDYRVQKEKDGKISVVNKGEIASPFVVNAIKNGQIANSVWYEGFTGRQTLDFPTGNYDLLTIDYAEKMPEVNKQNNTIRTSGLFKKIEPIRPHLFGSIPNPYTSEIYYTPIIGWNSYDKWMPGLAIYNSLQPQRRFEYLLAPMYGTNTNRLNGGAQLNWHIYPGSASAIHEVNIGLKIEHFTELTDPIILQYTKIAPQIQLIFNKPFANSTLYRDIVVRPILINPNLFDRELHFYQRDYRVFDARINLQEKRIINPYELSLNAQVLQFSGNEMEPILGKVSMTAQYHISYKNSKKQASFRAFAGYSKAFKKDYEAIFFSVTNFNGSADYMYDHTFLDRNGYNSVWSRQISEDEGGLKVAYRAITGSRAQSIGSLGAKIPFPGILPIGVFGDVVMYRYAAYNNSYTLGFTNNMLYDFGVYFPIYRDIFEVYIPLLYSKEISNTQDNVGSIVEQIHFMLRLEKMNPISFIRNIGS